MIIFISLIYLSLSYIYMYIHMNILNLAYSSDIFGSFVFVPGWQHGLLLALGRRLGCLGQEFFSCLQLSAVDAGRADGSGLETWIFGWKPPEI